jgi:hypothetical protein
VSVLINKTLSDFNFCNTVKHEHAVNNHKIHSQRLRGRKEGRREEEIWRENGEGAEDRAAGKRSKIGKGRREVRAKYIYMASEACQEGQLPIYPIVIGFER